MCLLPIEIPALRGGELARRLQLGALALLRALQPPRVPCLRYVNFFAREQNIAAFVGLDKTSPSAVGG